MNPWLQPEPANWWHIVDDAVEEDVGPGDVTSGCIGEDVLVRWYIEAQADGILCGTGIAEHLLQPEYEDDDKCTIAIYCVDGDRVQRGTKIIDGVLPARRALTHERTALNFMMHLSGVATLTSQFVQKAKGTNAKIVDTRKTLPGLRALQKYAIRCGGGFNHRMGLFDAAMIKDNHIRAAGGIPQAVARLRSYASHMLKVEVECESLEQVQQAIEAGADVVMLDNMDPFMMREAVKQFGERVLLEASGGISLDTVAGVAQTGVHIISVGALTHSVPSVPFHMEIE